MSIQKYRFTWNGIEIELVYEPLKWNVIAHLEVFSINPERAPLPITETGYLSHFHQPEEVGENEGTLIEQVTVWLDERVKTKHWKAYIEQSRQGNLFDLS